MVLIFTPFATMQKNKSTERQNKKFKNTSHQLNVAQNVLISNLPFPTYAAIIPVFRKKYRIGQMKSYPELHNLWQPGSRAVRKWKENGKIKRKWRENEEMERKWSGNEEMQRDSL